MWLSTQRDVGELLTFLAADPDYIVQEDVRVECDDMVERTPETEGVPVLIRGSVISSADRLDEEFTKSLQNIDLHGTDYGVRRSAEALHGSLLDHLLCTTLLG